MSQSLIGALRVTLGLDSAEFTRGTKKAAAEMTGFQKKMQMVGTAVQTAFAFLAGGAVLSVFADASRKGLEFASSLGETAQQLGVTTSALQRYRFIATQVGIEQDVMDKGLVKISGRLGDLAAGAEGAEKPFARLKLTQAELAQLSKMTAEDALPMLADKFKALGSETERVAAAQELFGAKMGGKFMTLLAGGRGEIDQLAAAYKKLGIEISGEQIAKADAAADKLAQLNMVVSAEQAKVIADNAQAYIKYEMAIAKLKATLAKGTGETIGFFSELSKGYDILKQSFDLADPAAKNAEKQKSSLKSMVDDVRWAYHEVRLTLLDWQLKWLELNDNAQQAGFRFGQNIAKMSREATRYIAEMVSNIRSWISNTLNAVWNGAISKIKEVVGWFDWMDNEVVRNSYVPDMVDGIAAQMKRLDAVMVQPVKAGTSKVAQNFREMQDFVLNLLGELFPKIAEQNAIEANIVKLNAAFKAGAIDAKSYSAAVEELNRQLRELKEGKPVNPEDDLAKLPDSTGSVEDQIDRLNKNLPPLSTTAKRTFEDMARGAQNTAATIANAMEDMRNSISGFINSIKKGDIIGIIGGLANVIGSVLDAFGKGGSLSGLGKGAKVPAYAGGTAFHPGGLAMVGEKGAELVRLPRGSQVFPHGTGPSAGAVQVMVTANDYFDAKVQQVSGGVVARTAPAIAQAGSQMAQGQMMARGRRRLA